ncbi:ribonuclease H-like domain-containing protein [Tanacetum coccineum]
MGSFHLYAYVTRNERVKFKRTRQPIPTRANMNSSVSQEKILGNKSFIAAVQWGSHDTWSRCQAYVSKKNDNYVEKHATGNISNSSCLVKRTVELNDDLNGFTNFQIRYIRGIWVWNELDAENDLSSFRLYVEMNKVFTEFKPIDIDFVPAEKVVWIDIVGVPRCAWTSNAFKKIDTLWRGEEGIRVNMNGKYYDVLIKEFACWAPNLKPDGDCESNESSELIENHGTNLVKKDKVIMINCDTDKVMEQPVLTENKATEFNKDQANQCQEGSSNEQRIDNNNMGNENIHKNITDIKEAMSNNTVNDETEATESSWPPGYTKWLDVKLDIYMVNVYAPQDEEGKQNLWHYIIEFMSNNLRHYIIFGDFNFVQNNLGDVPVGGYNLLVLTVLVLKEVDLIDFLLRIQRGITLMALTGKLVGHVEISSHADVLHDLLRHKPNDIASISEPVHSCDLVSGQHGVVGSVICWNYTHGKRIENGAKTGFIGLNLVKSNYYSNYDEVVKCPRAYQWKECKKTSSTVPSDFIEPARNPFKWVGPAHCQPLNQNFYEPNSSGFDQFQPPQYSVIHHPPQETSKEILQAREDLMEAIQAFLKEFDHIPPEEKCMALLLAEERFLKIKQVMEEEQNQPEDMQELLFKLMNDLQVLKGIQQEKEKPAAQSFTPYGNFSMIDDVEVLMKDIYTFLRKFSRIPFEVTPKVILIAWERFGEINHALTDKQYRQEDIQGLMSKLLDDVRNINEELSEYINCPSWNRPIFYNNDDEEYTIIYRKPKAITPVLPTRKSEDSLIMGDEHLDTIPEKESDELIKSSVENLVPIQSESEDFFDNGSDCDVPECNETFPTFTTFSNPLFDDEKIISPKIDPHYFNVESNLIESLLNRDILIDFSPEFDYLLEELSGKLAHINPIPPGIKKADFDLEEEIRLVENLLYDNSSPRQPEELNLEIADMIFESLSPSPILVEDSDSLMEEIDLFLASDDSMSPGIEDDDYDSEGDIRFLE